MAKVERQYHHGNLRRALLDAALAMLDARGGADFTMRELAREAGVTHSAPYRHFPDRAALLAAVAEEGFSLLAERCRAARAEHAGHPRAAVSALGRAYVTFAVEHPHHFRVMFATFTAEAREEHGSLAAAAHASFGELLSAVEACQKAGLLRKDFSTKDLGVVAWSMVHGISALLVSGQVAGGAERVPKLVRVLATTLFEGALMR